MKGILLISHGEMAKGMMNSISLFFGDLKQLDYLCLKKEDNPDQFHDLMKEKINQLNSGDGVIILADILGGTPCNQAAYLVNEDIIVLTGMNLGMLIAIMSSRQGKTIDIDMVLDDGKTGINCLNDLLGVKR
jgi:Phosphotransferase system, mannose/fructose-specific component IIA